jgi:hypothetical protein
VPAHNKSKQEFLTVSTSNDWQTPNQVGPYAPMGPEVPQPSSGTRTLVWILGTISLIFCLGAAACCGFGYWGFRQFQDQMSAQIKQAVAKSPEVEEHVGTISEVELSFSAMNLPSESGKMVFDVRGSKGSAQISVDPVLLQKEPEKAFGLLLPSGERIPLTGVSDPLSEPKGAEPPPTNPVPNSPQVEPPPSTPAPGPAPEAPQKLPEPSPAA